MRNGSSGFWIGALPVAMAVLAFGLGARECDPGGSGSCVVDGTVYTDGTRGIPAGDGCNTCSCEDGGLSCTEIGCPPTDGCMLDGTFYENGTTGIPAADGCNTCECKSGVLSCTDAACPRSTCNVFGVPYAERVPSPDGCNTCSCVDGQVEACTEIACAPIPIVPCSAFGARPSDRFHLDDVHVEGDTLTAQVSYSGGCQPHYFRLCYEGEWLESYPVQVNLRLDHDAQNDPCEAYPTETRQFDLRPLAEAYREGYREEHGTILLRLGEGASYTF
jgi:hypothetical protein